jgi:type IV pilus assembly protein PilQ
MKHVWTLAAVTAAALVGRNPVPAFALPSDAVLRGTPATTDRGPGTSDETPPRASSSVTNLRVVPGTGRAEVVIAVDSSVQAQDFVLEASPYRVVLDLTGARLDLAPRFYDRVARGSITNVRYAQYRAGVVRVVVELDGPHDYKVVRTAHEMRLAVEGGNASFAAWDASQAARSAGARAVATAVAEEAKTQLSEPAVPVTEVSDVVATAAGSVSDAPRERRHTFLQRGNQSSQPRITVTYQDSDIRDVLAAFAAFSGRTIVVGKDVQGTVTAEVRDQPWDVALQSILASQQLAASEDQYGIITVDSYKNIQAKQASEPLVTQLVTLNYANAFGLVKTVQSLLARDCGPGQGGGAGGAAPAQSQACQARGNVVADTGTNTLLITEAQSHMQDVVNYIRDLDIRTPQVSIKAKIIFVNRTVLNSLGLAYDIGDNGTFFNSLVQRINPTTGQPYSSNVTAVNIGGNSLAAVSNASRPYQLGAALSLLYTAAVGKFSLTSFIDATASLQLSDVQAEPSVVTLDNRLAQIQVGEETPIRVIDASASGSAGPPVATVQWKESGIILSVTPHITRDGQILMQLHAEQSQLQQVGGDLGYNFFKRAADTKLLVSDGETAVIGGLTETTVTKSKNAIPLLGELPLVGSLFSQTQTTDEKQDLLILITPRVIGTNDAVRMR